MKKLLKRALTLSLCGCMIMGITASASAAKAIGSNPSDMVVSIEQLDVASEVTFDEAVQIKMLNDNTSYEAAKAQLRAEENRIINELMLKQPLRYNGKSLSSLK